MKRFGKHPPKRDYRTLRFARYKTPALPAPLVSVSNLDRIYTLLGVNDPTMLFPIDGNDSLGDCTIAARAHAITAYRALIGKRVIPSKASVLKLYRHLTGGPDTGLAELDVLNNWRQSSSGAEQILAFASIQPTNHTDVQLAIQLFGGVYLGFQCQENCIQDFDAHIPWTPGPLTNDGHAVYAVDYDANGVTVLTWGSTQQGTWAWWDEGVDEAYAILPPEAQQPGFCPGYDITALQADLAQVGGITCCID